MNGLKIALLILFIFTFYRRTKLIKAQGAKSCGGIWKCCGGYKWDDTQKQCIPCEKGYFGVNCAEVCYYPSFGIDCQQECNCSEELCNHVVGCVESACEIGYFGVNCTETCPSPSYGIDCQQECNCSEELCDHIEGCLEPDAVLHTSKESSTILYTIFPSDQSVTLKTTGNKTTVRGHSINSAMRSLEDSNDTTMLIAILTLGVCFMTLVALYLKFSICSSRAFTQQNESFRDENVQIYENV